jgi:hypothetical protein
MALVQVAGSGGGVGAVTNVAGGSGITVSPETGNVVVTNSGVTLAEAGTGITVSAGTGTVIIGNSGLVSASGVTGELNTSTTSGALTITPGSKHQYVDLLGADPTGVTESSAAFNSALANLPTENGVPAGVIEFGPGAYKIGSTTQLTALQPQVTVIGAGMGATTVFYYGSGDCFRWQYPTFTGGSAFPGVPWGGGIFDLTVDGTHATAAACGLHYGDMEGFQYGRIVVQNFATTGAIGIHEDNAIWWTEKTIGQATIQNCTQGVVFDVTSGSASPTTSTASHYYSEWDFNFIQQAQQDGVVIQNGSTPNAGGYLRIRGNFTSAASGSNTATPLRITGTVPAGHAGAGSFSELFLTPLFMHCESDGGTGTELPTTIIFGAGSSNSLDTSGMMWFTGTGWQATNAGSTTGNLRFQGFVVGDSTLNPSGGAWAQTIGMQFYGTAFSNGSTGSLDIGWGDFFPAYANAPTNILSANITVNMAHNVAGPQRKTIFYQQAATGGPFTVTFPKPGSPSVSSPAVYFPSGTYVMSVGASAVDMIEMSTIDGIHWYARATQNLS